MLVTVCFGPGAFLLFPLLLNVNLQSPSWRTLGESFGGASVARTVRQEDRFRRQERLQGSRWPVSLGASAGQGPVHLAGLQAG